MLKVPSSSTVAVRLAATALSGVLALSGCGGGSGGVAVSGQVTLDGQPLETGTLTLIPEGQGTAATATISRGAYSIPEREGPTPGTYRVEIHSIQSTGRTAKKVVDPDYAGEETEDIIPPRYHQNSELRAQVKAEGENRFDFPLESAKGARSGRSAPPRGSPPG
jgi:hypothetical protein